MFTEDQKSALAAKLDPANVSSRQQAGRNLSYIEAWHAIAEANRIFGFDGWDRETVDLVQLGEPRLVDGKWRVGYRAKVRIRVDVSGGEARPLIREGCGFGSGIDKDMDQAHESALKEAESDAMKRALMTFGNPFGLALYDKSHANVGADAPNLRLVERDPPKEPSDDQPFARMAVSALQMAKTRTELAEWFSNNEATIAKQDDAAKAIIRAAYERHLAKLKGQAA